MKSVHVHYFAILRELTGRSEETVETAADTAADLFASLCDRYDIDPGAHYKLAINDEIADWSVELRDGDAVLLFPPVAGG